MRVYFEIVKIGHKRKHKFTKVTSHIEKLSEQKHKILTYHGIVNNHYVFFSNVGITKPRYKTPKKLSCVVVSLKAKLGFFGQFFCLKIHLSL